MLHLWLATHANRKAGIAGRLRITGRLLPTLKEAFALGACVVEVARRHDVSAALIDTWRRKLREAAAEPAPDYLAAPVTTLP